VAKKKNNRKKKKPAQQFVKLKPENYIRKHARKIPIHECLVDKKWRQDQFSPIVVSRKKRNGDLIVGTYIVDMQCLGVKDTDFYFDMTEFEYGKLVSFMEQNMGLRLQNIDPVLCFNIIYGAVEFAEDCGFQPHKGFDITEYLLDDVATIEFMEVPLGGKDGKPIFIAGPFDNSEKILATLERTKGHGNFEFVSGIHPDNVIYPDELVEGNREQILDEFFPEHLVDNKFDTLPGEDEGAFALQLTIASRIMLAGGGDPAFIKQQHEDDDKFYEDIVENTWSELEDDSDLDSYDGREEEYEIFREQVLWILEKIIEFEGSGFLLEENYRPELDVPTPEEIYNFSDEEMAAYEKDMLFYMTQEKRNKYLLGMYLTNFTEPYRAKQLGEKEIQEKILTEFLEGLKKNFFKDKWDADLEEECREVGLLNLEKLSRLSDEKK